MINIPSLPCYAFYKCLQRKLGNKINQFVNLQNIFRPSKDTFITLRTKLNELITQYENDKDNDKLENEVAEYYYYVSKLSNKQILKYRNKQIISKYNKYSTVVENNPDLEAFYEWNLLLRTNIIHSLDFDFLIEQCNTPETVILIDLMQKPYDFYVKITFNEAKIFELFEKSNAMVIVVFPNSFYNRNLFQNYIRNIEDYKDDKTDYSLDNKINSNRQLIVTNKIKYI
jgi:hypothetical protein